MNNENVINFSNKPKNDRYKVFVGQLDGNGYFVEKDQVGLAFRRSGSGSFRLKLWMHLSEQYYIVPNKEDQTKYNIYSIDEYISETKELKSFWNKVGFADLDGNYLKLQFFLLPEPVYLSLFEDKNVSTAMSSMEVA